MSLTNETKMVHRARHITELSARQKNKLRAKKLKILTRKIEK